MRNNPLGYLTTTMVRSYDCPKKYFYEYVEGWRPLRPSANLVFGSIVHESIAEGLSNGHLTKDLFIEKWKKVEELIYSRSDTHQSLEGIGLSLISKLEKTPVYRRAVAVEKAYQVELADGTIFKGKIDIIYNDGRENVVLDWKTSSRSFLDSRPELDDQLTAYSMLAGIP
ncbi:MAG: PD-(D/E)XK nuclease family protein, partial [Candidatus Omnitrophica bacterium]|nr:PD-(D/E)XK nuclease family protein [Candidatus Omnitrophota bacterium]